MLRSLQGDISIRDSHTEFHHLQSTREITYTETLVFVVCFYLLFANPQGYIPQYLVENKLFMPRSRSGRGGEKKNTSSYWQ